MGEGELREGMVDPESLKELALTWEKIGEARKDISTSSSSRAELRESITTLFGDKGSYDEALLYRAASIFDNHKIWLNKQWSKYEENYALSKVDTISGEHAKVAFEEITNHPPEGEVTLCKSNLAIHFKFSSPEDMKVLSLENTKRGGKPRSPIGGLTSGEAMTNLMAPSDKQGGITGIYTAELIGQHPEGLIQKHEEKHIENVLWSKSGLFSRRVPKSDEKDSYLSRQRGKAIIGELPIFMLPGPVILGPDYDTNTKVYHAFETTHHNRADADVLDEFLARLAGDPELQSTELAKQMDGANYLCFQLQKALVIYMLDAKLSGTAQTLNETGYIDRLDLKMKQILEKQKDKVIMGREVLTRVGEHYQDATLARYILTVFPLSKWPAVERILVKYGTKSSMD